MTTISDRQKLIIIGLFCAIFVASSFYWYKTTQSTQGIVIIDNGMQQEQERDNQLENQANLDDSMSVDNRDPDVSTVIDERIYVHVKGAVKQPGVYILAGSQRVIDAVEAAGGASAEGNLDLINLAGKLYDGQEVVVFTSIEEQHAWNTIVNTNSNANTSMNTSGPSTSATDKVNINTATSQQLQSLPGIGPSKADAIIRYREQNGPFRNIESIVNVGGIGQITFENLQDRIVAQ